MRKQSPLLFILLSDVASLTELLLLALIGPASVTRRQTIYLSLAAGSRGSTLLVRLYTGSHRGLEALQLLPLFNLVGQYDRVRKKK